MDVIDRPSFPRIDNFDVELHVITTFVTTEVDPPLSVEAVVETVVCRITFGYG